jgi:hypothetical protein
VISGKAGGLCLEIQPGSVGVLEDWSIGMKAEDYDVFLFLYLPLLHYSITPLFQKDPEITGIINPLWG